jgi:WD40 repeat protein
MTLLAPVARAITIRLAEVQNDVAVVKGRKAAAYQTIFWQGVPVTTATKNGSFSFEGEVPTDCIGMLSDGVTTIDVELDNCPSDPGGGGGGGVILELPLEAEQTTAHTGDSVRAVGFVGDLVISGGEDAYLRSWYTPLLGMKGEAPLDHTIYDLETSADGSIVVTGEGGWNGGPGSDTLRVWNVTASLVGTTAPIGFVYCVAISPDNLWTVASGFYGDIVVYETAGLELVVTKKTKKRRTKALAFSPGGSALASTSTAGRIQLWSFPEDCAPGSCELSLLPVSMSHSGSWTFPIAFAPGYDSTPEGKEDATEIVSGTDSGTIKVWTIKHLASGEPSVSVVSVDSGAVYALAWSPDGGKIVAGGNDDITVYDADTLEILFQNLDAHDGRVNDVAFSPDPDSSWIASGGADGTLKLWWIP